jgi:hypothetical protein
MRTRPALIWAVLLIACDSAGPVETIVVSETIELTIEIDPSPGELPPVAVAVAGPKFFEKIQAANDPVIVVVPRPNRYLFQVGGVIEESTGPTSGCWWSGQPTWVEVSTPTTVQLGASQACG